MAKTIYAILGSFTMRPGMEKGVRIFKYGPEEGTFALVGAYRTDINAGQIVYSEEKDMVYLTHEFPDRDGEKGGGGRVHCLKLDHETGEPTWINERETFAALPAYICLDKENRYALVPHHGLGTIVTKTKRDENGRFYSVTESDDVTMALFRLAEDGSYLEMCDAIYHEPERENGAIKKTAHLHSCILSPDQKLFLACDKGLDRVHGYRLDAENGKLIKLGDIFVEEGVHPRYGVFHPTLPVFYQNCENSTYIHSWEYESETGVLTHVGKTALLEDEETVRTFREESGADIVVTPDGKNLYVSVRTLNVLSVLAIDENGGLTLIQTIGCQGKNPRGLALSPDGRFLFSINRETNQVARFRRLPDGTLEADGIAAEGSTPAVMRFIVYD